MGKTQSCPTLKPLDAQTCATVTAATKRKCMPVIIDMIPAFINDYIARAADTPLPILRSNGNSGVAEGAETRECKCLTEQECKEKYLAIEAARGKSLSCEGKPKCMSIQEKQRKALEAKIAGCKVEEEECRTECVKNAESFATGPVKPKGSECKIGTLRNIQLCDIVKFRAPTKISCDFEIWLHSIAGAENMRITHFSYATVGLNDDKLLFNLEITFGILTATMSMTSTGENCGTLGWGHATAVMLACKNTTVKIGSENKPVKLNLSLNPWSVRIHPIS